MALQEGIYHAPGRRPACRSSPTRSSRPTVPSSRRGRRCRTRPRPCSRVTTFYRGFQRNDRRSWIGFHDGLSNLRSADREAVIAIDPGADEDWAVGGTYLAFLRLAVDLPGWRRLTGVEQELAVGRDKLSGCPITGIGEDRAPLTDAGCPAAGTEIWQSENDAGFAEPPEAEDPRVRASHVQRANHHQRPASDSGTRRIFRQGWRLARRRELRRRRGEAAGACEPAERLRGGCVLRAAGGGGRGRPVPRGGGVGRGHHSHPISVALSTAWARSATPSFAYALCRCVRTVLGESPSSCAMTL